MRETLCTVTGIMGAGLTYFIGGADTVFVVLCILMGFDYLTGLMVAVVFHKSPKTISGGASSAVGFKGICKKVIMLGMVGVANQLDLVLGTDFIRSGLVYAFIANEIISIIENAGFIGIPIPGVLKKAIDLLTEKEESINGYHV